MKQTLKGLLSLMLSAIICLQVVMVSANENVSVEETPVVTEETENKEEAVPTISDISAQSKNKTLIYVAPNGSDSNEGTMESPLATLIGARDKIRVLKASGSLGADGAVVYFRGGEYIIKEGTTFKAEDSGTEEAPIVYRNYPGEEVNFIGGAYLNWSDFKQVKDESVLNRIVDENARKHIVAINLHELGYKDLPEQMLPGTYSYWAALGTLLKEEYGVEKPTTKGSELVINGEGATIARYPNEENLTIGEVLESGNFQTKSKYMEVVVNDGRIKNWTNAKDAIMSGTFCHSWAGQATYLDSVNVKKNSLRSKYPVWYGAVDDQQFYVYNLIEEIDMPGEYYIDRENGMLYLYAPDDVKEVIYTLLTDTMVSFNGAHYVTLKGINMKYTRGNFVSISRNSENIEIVDCDFTYNTNSGAVSISGSNNRVYDCYFYNCAMGVTINIGDRATLTKGNSVVENCKFENCERTSKTYSPALYVQGCGAQLLHNEISDAEHCVIQLGGNYHNVNFNEIYNACMNTDDMGAIYTGRNLTMRGNVFKNNYIHDIGGANRGTNGTHGMFFDDFWECADVVGNVFANITGAGIMFAGSYNVVNNNIFANTGTVNGASMNLNRSYLYGGSFDDTEYVKGVKEMPIESDVWVDAFPEIVNVIDKSGKLDINNHIVVTNNVLYQSPEPRISAEIKKTLVSENNVSFQNDPGFYDLENENYLLKEDSKVYEMIPDFKPIPFTRMGRYADRAMARAKKGYVFCTESPFVIKDGKTVKTDKTQAIIENETVYVPLRSGADAVKAQLTYDEATEKITVSASGKMLEFTDGATDSVVLNGAEYALSKPLVNINDSNYIALSDLANIFEQYIIKSGDIYIVTDFKDLFRETADAQLLRYIEAQLTVY